MSTKTNDSKNKRGSRPIQRLSRWDQYVIDCHTNQRFVQEMRFKNLETQQNNEKLSPSYQRKTVTKRQLKTKRFKLSQEKTDCQETIAEMSGITNQIKKISLQSQRLSRWDQYVISCQIDQTMIQEMYFTNVKIQKEIKASHSLQRAAVIEGQPKTIRLKPSQEGTELKYKK